MCNKKAKMWADRAFVSAMVAVNVAVLSVLGLVGLICVGTV